jgi:hypothetical protein
VTLTDAGPLIAIIDADEPDHDACLAALDELALPLVTTWPAFTEAMYLLGEAGGWYAQETLWSLLERGDLVIAAQGAEDYKRMRTLMHKYRDRPMDLADASLVCLAEQRGLREIFTLDKEDFRIYRLHGRQTFSIWPADP